MFYVFHLFTLLFVTLKLTGYVAWSWFAVLSPSLISLLIIVVMLVVAVWPVTKLGHKTRSIYG